ncbi:MAG: S1/P1 nuclease [Bacteroidota bacterium]
MRRKIFALLYFLPLFISAQTIPSPAIKDLPWDWSESYIYSIIAENHLSSQVSATVNYHLLNSELRDYGDYRIVAVEHQYKPEFSNHFLNVPAGLNYSQFCEAVKTPGADNIYTYILKCQDSLRSQSVSDYSKHFFLLALVHAVGDAHLPLQTNITGDEKYIQLPGSCDSLLIEHYPSTLKRATLIDTVSAKQVEKWQSDSLTQWLYESYLLRARLNKQIKDGKIPSKNYIRQYKSDNQLQIEKAGIRLAAVLNELFKNEFKPDPKDERDFVNGSPILSDRPEELYGNTVMVCGRVTGHQQTDTTLVLKIRYWGDKVIPVILTSAAKQQPDEIYSSDVCATGKIVKVDGKPAMIIYKRNRFTIERIFIDPVITK